MAQFTDFDRLALEAGVSPAMFNQAFLDTLWKFKARFNWDNTKLAALLSKGRHALSKRRSFLLPLNCAPEDLHREKDRWTFVVWICFLLHEIPDISSIESLLRDILDEKVYAWLKHNPACLEVITAFYKGDTDTHTAALKRILSVPDSQISEIDSHSEPKVMPVEPRPTSSNDLPETELKATGPTKRDLGEKFVRFLADNTDNLPLWAKSNGDYVDVESPKGFQEYAVNRGENWMSVQQGVQKMRIHQPDPEGKPFIKVNGKNVIRLKTINIL